MGAAVHKHGRRVHIAQAGCALLLHSLVRTKSCMAPPLNRAPGKRRVFLEGDSFMRETTRCSFS